MENSAAARDANAARALARTIADSAALMAPPLAEVGPLVENVAWEGDAARRFKAQFAAALPGLNRAVNELLLLELDLLTQSALQQRGAAPGLDRAH
jgi:hypothetical protein